MPVPPESPASLQDLLDIIDGHQKEPEPAFSGLTNSSQEVEPGGLFVAISGTAQDGHEFVEEAVARGARALVVERDVGDQPVPVIRVEDSRRALAELAIAYYGRPADFLILIGITGSLGKTSVLTMTEAILEAAGRRVGAIGSEIVGVRVHDHFDLSTPNTTPDPITLQRGIRKMVDEGADVAAMEITSHALDQERVHGLQFPLGIFTNLVSDEHLDYHGSFEEYARVKMTFCDYVIPDGYLIYGADSELLRQQLAGRDLLTIGCGFSDDADVRIARTVTSYSGTRFELHLRKPLPLRAGTLLEREVIEFEVPLLGRPHVLNCTFAVVTALHLGVSEDIIQKALSSFEAPRRRMEIFDIGRLHVLDDTTGHPESVDAVFDVVHRLPHRRLHVVAAIRGQRGGDVNGRLAAVLARQYREQPFDSLLVTDSSENVDERDQVAEEERNAYLSELEASDVRFRHLERLEDAIMALRERVGEGDLVVLMGAQGMRSGADLARHHLSGAR